MGLADPRAVPTKSSVLIVIVSSICFAISPIKTKKRQQRFEVRCHALSTLHVTGTVEPHRSYTRQMGHPSTVSRQQIPLLYGTHLQRG